MIHSKARVLFLASLTLGAVLVAPASGQTRVKKAAPLTFAEAVAAANKAYEAGNLSAVIDALGKATKAVRRIQRNAVIAAMPEIEGLTKKPQPKNKEEEAEKAAAMFGGMAGLAGMAASQIEQEYTGDKKSATLKVNPNMPMAGMMKMQFENPAMADGAEPIQYANCKGLLKDKGNGRQSLRILAQDKILVEFTTRGLSGDEVLKAISQERLDALLAPFKPKANN